MPKDFEVQRTLKVDNFLASFTVYKIVKKYAAVNVLRQSSEVRIIKDTDKVVSKF